MSNIKVANTPLTNTIYAGTVLKTAPNRWGKNKTDVTLDCLFSVADHVQRFGEPIILSTEGDDGKARARYKITVERLDQDRERKA